MKDGAFEEGEFNRSLSTIVYVCAILTIVSFWLIQLESVLKPFFIALAPRNNSPADGACVPGLGELANPR